MASSSSEEWQTSDSYSGSTSESDEVRPTPIKEYPAGYNMHESIAHTRERIIADVPEPAKNRLTDEEFWESMEPKRPNVARIKEHLSQEGRTHVFIDTQTTGKFEREHLLELFDIAYEVYCAEDNVLIVPAPVNVCGDVHGQFYDLLKLLEIGGDPKEHSYLFLGDYVDRGDFSLECVILLFSYKILYPNTFFMLRGNHECRHLTDYFTFKEECEQKYDKEIYDAVMDVFDALPLAAVMNNQFFCVHGGLSPEITNVDDINDIDRFTEPPSKGPMCDLLWADPMEDFSPSNSLDFTPNDTRGTSYCFGYKATVEFLNKHKWLSVIRAHEAQDSGYRMYAKNQKTGFPALITLFSAPNYLTHYNNKGAIMRYENNSMTIKQFTDSPHPYYLPSFMNVFDWSLPFVAEKLGELLLVFLRLVNDAEADNIEEQQQKRAEVLRKKVITVSRMLNMFKTMRTEREMAVALNGLTIHTGQLPETLKGKSTEEFKNQLGTFSGVKAVDAVNEARPGGIEKALDYFVVASTSSGNLKRQASKKAILEKKRKNNIDSPRKSSTSGSEEAIEGPLPTISTQ